MEDDGYTACDQQKTIWTFANEGDRVNPDVFLGLEAKSLETYRNDDRWQGILKMHPGKVKRGKQVLTGIRKWNTTSSKPVKLIKMEGQDHHIVPFQDRQGKDTAKKANYEIHMYTHMNSAQTAVDRRLMEMENAHNLAIVKLQNDMQRQMDAKDNAHNIERIRDRMMLETKTEMCVKLEDQVKELGGVKMNDIQMELATVKVELSKLKEENASLIIEVGQLKLKIEGLESDKKQLTLDTSEVKQLVKKHKRLETLFEDQKKTLTSKETRFEEEKADMQTRLDKMRSDLKKSEAKVKEYEKRIEDGTL